MASSKNSVSKSKNLTYVATGTFGSWSVKKVGAGGSWLSATSNANEDALSFSMEWVRYHDRYGTNEFADADKPYWPEVAQTETAGCGCGSSAARA